MYIILKFIVRVALRIFFKRYQVHNAQFLNISAPLIVVANHPNTFMDPLIIATLLNQELSFLANGSIFKGKFLKWLWRQFNMIPIYRKTDVKEGVSQAEQNKRAFVKCYEFLGGKGSLLIFPEGSSFIERRLREIKTGTARIALGAEYENQFDLNLKILPIGLNYSDAKRFRSDVLINIGEPIEVKKYQNLYNPENFDAVEALTKDIEQSLEHLIIDTEDHEEDSLVVDVENVYKNELFREFELSGESKADDFLLTKNIIEAIRFFRKEEPEKLEEIRSDMQNYLQKLQKIHLKDEMLSHQQSVKSLFWTSIGIIFYLLITTPLYLYGLINNYIPYLLPSKVANLITKDEAYRAPLMLVTGIFAFIIFYSVQIYWFSEIISNTNLTIGYMISLPLSGFFVLHYWSYLERVSGYWYMMRLISRKPAMIKEILRQREALLEMLSKAKGKYLEKTESQ